MKAGYIDLHQTKKVYERSCEGIVKRIIICAGTGCVANGSLKVYDALVKSVDAAKLNVIVELKDEKHDNAMHISKSGCQGFCQMGPLVTVLPENILYTKVGAADVPEIVEKTLKNGEIIDRLLYCDPNTSKHCRGVSEIPFYTRQCRFVLKECGIIDPEDINEYIARDGYSAAENSVRKMSGEEVCRLILDSGLRGRGGGGFPTGRKWDFVRNTAGEKKYVIVNGDEGDPGAFMDRSLMEGDPHAVLEGMAIAAYAVGA
ncbi:MAG TPA: NAD(P)H-dependent oxidoreductase subunit E, partial [Candidatus Wallbacteria bacterium]|nr:NAD(P)H-dependent oxidoreductase subunit E [Candidatus Wallbacteria bacterium]